MGYQAGEIPMENVHGISVSGGSFPAEIWRLMMERTIGLRAACGTSPTPKAYPQYQPFHRGPLALSYDPLLRRPDHPTTTETHDDRHDADEAATPQGRTGSDQADAHATQPPKHP